MIRLSLAITLSLASVSSADEAMRARYLGAKAAAEHGKIGPASEELELLALHYAELKDRCAHEAAVLFEQRGMWKKAVELWSQIPPEAFVFGEARLAQARVLREHGLVSDAVAAIDPLLDRPAPRPLRKRAVAERLSLAYALKDTKKVSELRSLPRFWTPPEPPGDPLFQQFWAQWRMSPRNADVTLLKRIDELPVGAVSAQDRARARYFRARVAQEQGAQVEAAAMLAEVAVMYPATYYAHLVRARLKEPRLELSQVLPAALSLPEGTASTLSPGIEALTLGLDGAVDEVVALARVEPSAAINREVVEVLWAYGELQAAHRFARAVMREELGGRQQDELVWQAAFPTRFSGEIRRWAEAAQVPSPLLQALVREESAFNPAAKSHVGARGLTQLMPVTARALARERGSPLKSLEQLTEPGRNLELGAHYLGQLLRRFDGQAAFAAAGYNGGPTRVARWLKEDPPASLETWVEEIPLDETRNYVKDVLASSGVYAHYLSLDRGELAVR